MALKKLLTNLEQGLNAYLNHNTPSERGGFNYSNSTSIFDTKEFNQKSLSFGKDHAYDRPQMGFSREPFITNPTVDLFANNPDIQILGDTLTDGLIRGGAITHAERLITDGERIGRFLLTPKGIAFNIKQVGLQKTNPKIGKPGVLISKANQRTYNLGINTLASVISAGTGLRIKREGLLPTSNDGYVDANKLFEDYRENKNNNRLLNLFDANIIGYTVGELYSYSGGPGSTYGIGKTQIRKYDSTENGGYYTSFRRLRTNRDFIGQGFLKENKLNLQPTPNNMRIGIESTEPDLERFRDKMASTDFYAVLPHLYHEKISGNLHYGPSKGIPGVTHKFGELTAKHGFVWRNLIDMVRGARTVDIIQIPEPDSTVEASYEIHKTFQPVNNTTSKAKNFALKTKNLGTNYNETVKGFPNKTYHREERINMGNPGARSRKDGFRDSYLTHKIKDTNFHDYSLYDPSKIDTINSMDIFDSDGDTDTQYIRDLIRFKFEMVNNDNIGKSDKYETTAFRALLDNIDDNFSANHNTFKYNGRGEEFYTYNSFKRNINFSFKIAATSRHEMMPLYRKLNFLVSNTAPDYGATGRMRTPFVRLTIGSWMDRIPGVINSVNVKWQKDYPWEISISSPEGNIDKHMNVLPHVLDVSVQFTPVHNFLPKKSVHSPFILPHTVNRKTLKPPQRWTLTPASPTIQTSTVKDVRERMNKLNKEVDLLEEFVPTVNALAEDVDFSTLTTKPPEDRNLDLHAPPKPPSLIDNEVAQPGLQLPPVGKALMQPLPPMEPPTAEEYNYELQLEDDELMNSIGQGPNTPL